MLVVQGLAQEADVALFGFYCDPNVVTSGGIDACAARHFRAFGGYSSAMACGPFPSGAPRVLVACACAAGGDAD